MPLPIAEGFVTKAALDDFCSSSVNYLKIIHVNAQSLTYRCHAEEFQLLFANSGHDIISVSETFYKTIDDVVPLPGFNCFTSNRMSHEGGGVAVYVRDTIKCTVLSQSAPSLIREQRPDFLIAKISVCNTNILFATVYRPPKAGYLSTFQDELFTYGIDFESVFVTGDVNAHFDSIKPCDLADGKGVQELLNVCNLTRVPFNATFHTSTCDSALDMIATSCMDKLIKYMQIPVCGLSAHDLLYAVFSFKVPKSQPTSFARRDFSKFNQELFKSDVIAAPWEKMLDYTVLNDKLSVFNEILLKLYDKHAPMRSHNIKCQPKPWISPELTDLINQRDSAYRRSRRTKRLGDINAFKTLRNLVNRVKRDAKIKYAYSVFNIAKSPKKMWDALKKIDVRNKKPESCIYPPAEELNRHYSSVTCMDSKAVENMIVQYEAIPPLVENDNFYFSDVTFAALSQAINSVKSNAMGIDKISLRMIKSCIVELAPAILHLFNVSLQTSQFPEVWKIADIKPIPKKANASSPKEFRPISILCILGKILEKIVHSQITTFMTKNGIFHPLQSGFKAGHSTTTALLKVTGDIREAMGNRQLAILVLYDFSNAFPSVHHGLMLSKLRNLGLSNPAVKWFQSYLTDRKQQVSTGSDVSSLLRIEYGVPQGSVLGPLLYSLYVNDISNVFNSSNFHLYADDLQNYVTFKPSNFVTAVNTINNEARKLALYAKSHNLAINGSKTQVMLMGNSKLLNKLPPVKPPVIVESVPLPYLNHVTNLGLVMDSHLTWERSALSTCQKSIAALQTIRRHKDLLPTAVRKKLVESLVFPILDYGATVTVDMLVKSRERLQRIQNACARLVLNVPRFDHISCHIRDLKWLTLYQRRDYYLLCLLKKVMLSQSPPYLYEKLVFVNSVHSRSLRNCKPLLRLPQHSTDKMRSAFWITSVTLWNDLPESLMLCKTIDTFKKHLLAHLLLN